MRHLVVILLVANLIATLTVSHMSAERDETALYVSQVENADRLERDEFLGQILLILGSSIRKAQCT